MAQPNTSIEETLRSLHNKQRKSTANTDKNTSTEGASEYKLPPWLKKAQVMIPGNLIVGEPFDSIPAAPPSAPPSAPPPVGGPLPVQSTVISPNRSTPTESSTLLTTAPLVINGLLVATVAMIMIVRPQMQEIQRTSQQAKETEETNVQAEDSSKALGILVVFLMVSAIYISPYLRKYVPPIVRLIAGIMIGIIFNLALKFIH